MKIKVGFCVAYDWAFLQHSLPCVYEEADMICIGLDKDRISWSGQPFSFDENGFHKLIETIDVGKKIQIYEEDFHLPHLSPMENEIRQRNRIAGFLGTGDSWHIQLDTDEYLLDFKGFVGFLKRFTSRRKVNICCPMLNLYKQLPQGMLWIKPATFSQIEYFPIASRFPLYEHGRRNGYFNILTRFPILHQSWARDEKEIWEKLNNWGHSKDFNVQKEFSFWKQAGSTNYKTYKNFHFLHPETWPALELQLGVSHISDILRLDKAAFPLPLSDRDLKKANSVWLSRARKLLKMKR